MDFRVSLPIFYSLNALDAHVGEAIDENSYLNYITNYIVTIDEFTQILFYVVKILE